MYFFLIIATPFRKKGYMTDYNVTFSQLVFSYYVPPFLHNPKRNSFHYVTTFQNKKKGFSNICSIPVVLSVVTLIKRLLLAKNYRNGEIVRFNGHLFDLRVKKVCNMTFQTFGKLF